MKIPMKKIDLKNDKYVLSISFANYLKGISGMAKVLMEHQIMYNEQNISYVNLFIVKKYLFKERITAFCYYGLVIDGNYQGIYTIEQIINLLYKFNNDNKILLDIHFHHFLYIKIKHLYKLLEHVSYAPVKVFLHDYYTICWNYTLLDSNKEYCGPSGISESKCSDCAFYKRSRNRTQEIRNFLFSYINRITVIAPSEIVRQIWLITYPQFKSRTIVILHQKEIGKYTGNLSQIPPNQKIKIGFLGMPAEHKGWDVWKDIVRKYKDTDQYEFIVFNSSDDMYENMEKVKIKYSSSNLNVMTEALRNTGIHLVLLWAKWPETYSYTLYESLSANAFILTNRISGNITDQIEKRLSGIVFNNEKELMDLLRYPDCVRKMINNFRKSQNYGPMYLEKNNDIVHISRLEGHRKSYVKNIINIKLYNYPLLYVLRILYKYNKIPG